MMNRRQLFDFPVLIPAQEAMLDARLTVPAGPVALVVIASLGDIIGASRDQSVASRLSARRNAVLRVDLLSRDGEFLAMRLGSFRPDGALLRRRLDQVLAWVRREVGQDLAWTLMAGAADPSVAHTLLDVIEKTGGQTAVGAGAQEAIGAFHPLHQQLRESR